MNVTATRLARISFVMLPEVIHLERIEQRLRGRRWHAAKLGTMAALASVFTGKRGQPA